LSEYPEVIELSAEYIAIELDKIEEAHPTIRAEWDKYLSGGGCECCWEDHWYRLTGSWAGCEWYLLHRLLREV
jgi:hypothetical protein